MNPFPASLAPPPVAPHAERRDGWMIPLLLGNALEWFDFALYGFFAAAIARHFFAPGDAQAAMLATAATFGAAFLMRPLGAVVVGHLGDRRGRKHALVLSFGLLALGTAMVGLALGDSLIPAWYVLATGLVSVGTLLTLEARDPLPRGDGP